MEREGTSRRQAPGCAPAKPPRRGRPPLGEVVQRGRILEAATRLFLARSFDGTSLDLVAREAGVTKRTIYEMVGDKEALFRAVCHQTTTEMAGVTFPDVDADASLREVLFALARALLVHALDPSKVALTRMVTLETLRFPGLVMEILNDGLSYMNARIMAVFDAIDAHGLAAIPDSAFAADLFYDLVVGNHGFQVTIGFPDRQVTDEILLRRLDVFTVGYLGGVATTN